MTKGPVRLEKSFGKGIPGADKRATEMLLSVAKTSALLLDEVTAHLRPSGLSPSAFNMLMVVRGAEEPLCPSEIGARLLVTRGTVTGLLDSLEKKGLIKRLPDTGDRRMLRIQITPKGAQLLDQITPDLHRHEASMLKHLSATEKETVVLLLTKAAEGLKQD